ncbi:hypothetical protein NEOLEDRAFT_1133208 [Neolentinus lepideus HHB14362 ss-1]|uniref:Uncharacterized protein n=1 Tax=Neolentinus lepideus HHB14362 ss-1 TaxID=1314782 RepID=A0A165SUH8_9AGAM|nr:hypothetical protein NEOLEDRAFT_1133208 [Neolentinus lepideus HHB14362 ss-1]
MGGLEVPTQMSVSQQSQAPGVPSSQPPPSPCVHPKYGRVEPLTYPFTSHSMSPTPAPPIPRKPKYRPRAPIRKPTTGKPVKPVR